MKHSTKFRLIVGASIFALTATLGTGAMAADTATLQGHVASGTSGTVTVTDTATGQSTTATVRPDGSYIIVGLRPSSYHVTAGSASDDITLAVGETTTLDLDATVAAAPEPSTTITVVGRRSKEVRTSEIATSVSQTQIENLPQNDRNFMNFAAMAPGVTLSTDPYRKTFQSGALGANQVNVFIDGQSFKNQVQQGGIAGQDSSQGNPFPQLAVQEFKVSTQNFKAEFEMAGSAIITAVTKTGGTEFHGTVFAEYMGPQMFGRPYFDRPGHINNLHDTNADPDYHRSQYGFDIGGPIIKNKLHFYLSYEGADQANPSTAVNLTNPTSNAALDPIFTAENGTFEQPFKQDLWFGKLTWFATDADTVDLSIFDRHEFRVSDFGGNRPYSQARDVDNKVQNYLLEWTHRGDNWLSEASLAWQSYHWTTPFHSDETEETTLVNGPNGGEFAYLGGQPFTQDKGYDTTTFKENLTLTGLEWRGSHVVKMGIKVATNDYTAEECDHCIPEFVYDGNTYDPSGTNTPLRAKILLNPSANIASTNTQVGLFIQDDWTIDEHWALNLGVRWDYENNMLNNKFVTPDAIATALRNYTGFIAAGFDPENYISNGHNRDAFTGAFQPRLGFSYDINGDRDKVIFGGYGRYYDRTLYGAAQSEVRATINQVATVNFGTGPGEIPWSESYRDPEALRAVAGTVVLGGGQSLLNNDTKVPYSDQINIGFRKRFGDINTSISYANIKSYDGFEYVRGNREPDGSYSPVGLGVIRDNFGPGSSPACATIDCGLPGFGRLEIGSNDRKTKYNALYLTVDKAFTRASGYGYSGTLTLADALGMGIDVENAANYTAGASNAYGYGASPGVSKIRFVGTGIVRGPWDTTLSANVTLASGGAYGGNHQVCTGTTPDYCYTYFNYYEGIFPEDKLAFQQVDVRIAKDFELPNGQVITLDGQVYNLFDHVNRVYSAWGGKENNTQGVARSFQVGLKYKF